MPSGFEGSKTMRPPHPTVFDQSSQLGHDDILTGADVDQIRRRRAGRLGVVKAAHQGRPAIPVLNVPLSRLDPQGSVVIFA